MHKVTVIVPVYNVEKWMGKCLDSLAAQSLEGLKVLVVDDGSTDGTGKLAKEYETRYPDLIEVRTTENRGLSETRNLGIEAADSEYIGFVDGDDCCEPDMFKKMYEAAVGEDADLVVCDWYAVNGKKKSEKVVKEGEKKDYAQENRARAIKACQPYAWSKLYRLKIFRDNPDLRYPAGRIYEDIPVTFPFLLLANRIVKIDEPLYRHTIQRKGAITAGFGNNICDMFLSLADANEFFKKAGKFEQYRDALRFVNLRHVYARFMDFKKYNNRRLKNRILKQGVNLLKKDFPEWKRDNAFFNTTFGKIKGLAVRCVPLWKMYVFKDIFAGKKAAFLRLAKRSILNRNLYAMFSKCGIRENTVLFESFHGREISDSPLEICKKLHEEGKYRLYFTTDKDRKAAHRTLLNSMGMKDVKLLPLKSIAYHRILATANYLVNNVTFPAYFIRREGQIYLNTWHGTPLKTLGKSDDKSYRDLINSERNFLQATHLLFPNRYTRDRMFADYNLEGLFTGKSMIYGYPRNDAFFDDADREEMREKYGLKGFKTYAYMPTWRGSDTGAKSGAEGNIMEMLELLDKSLPDGSKLFVKLHQLVDCAPDYSSYKHIEAFPADIGTYAFLNCVDVLITDYSSVMIDFSASGKEVILFMYDHDEYMGSRGFYKDPAELPFTVFYDKEAFVEYLKKGENDKPFSLPDDYIKEFIPYDKGDAAAKIIDEVFHGRDAIAEKCDHKENRDAERTVYVFSGFENPKTEKVLAEAAKKSGSVMLFRQDKFSNPEALTLSQIAGDTPWAIAAPYMHLGFFEGISLEFKNEDKPEKYAKIFKRELNRVLPGIKIKDIVCLDDSFYAKAISCAFYGK